MGGEEEDGEGEQGRGRKRGREEGREEGREMETEWKRKKDGEG